MTDKQKGFTLIELLVTMGIIAVLAGMAVFNFNQARMRARDVQRKSDLSQLQNALELYKNDNGLYPANLTNQTTTLVTPGYAKTVFVDPKGLGAWYDYTYTTTDQKSYTISTCLENSADTARFLPTIQCPSLVNTGAIYQVTNP